MRFERDDGGIEALQVTYLKDAPGGGGGCDQTVRRREIRRHGLFDEQIDARFEQWTAGFGMCRCWNGYYRRIRQTHDLARFSERRAPAVLCGDGLGARAIHVDHGRQLRVLGLVYDPRVVASKLAGSNERYLYPSQRASLG